MFIGPVLARVSWLPYRTDPARRTRTPPRWCYFIGNLMQTPFYDPFFLFPKAAFVLFFSYQDDMFAYFPLPATPHFGFIHSIEMLRIKFSNILASLMQCSVPFSRARMEGALKITLRTVPVPASLPAPHSPQRA